ncbi:hypothetical protein [Oryza sativa Japonica Group]|uniref:Uncharacterized protein n=1 Tax=Oryza sativa subsp. japonica TaxID=39947 RepID=Q5Z8F7_ORYSJ|nr:hypothetical protein [Oryza sativa Japonica Group]
MGLGRSGWCWLAANEDGGNEGSRQRYPRGDSCQASFDTKIWLWIGVNDGGA